VSGLGWRSRWFGGSVRRPPDTARWVVLDVETTGLDMHHDHLLAIAATAVHIEDDVPPRVLLADSFEAVLQHESRSIDKANILLHGIGVAEQRAGSPPREVLLAFEHWIGSSPLVGFHAQFDRSMIGRAMRQAVGRQLSGSWLDLAPVASVLYPEVGGRTLDDWLAHFHIECAVRHQAAADMLATAELLQRLWPAASAQGCASFDGLSALGRHQRWLRHGA
jgi:DNA polymerase-3 subunit epsilon